MVNNMDEAEYISRLKKIQNIVDWREEERVGLGECSKLWALPKIDISDIKNRSKNLPKDIDIFITGGLTDRGYTKHDIDVFIINNSDKSKDTIDSEVHKAFLGHKGRNYRLYNLDKFEKDMMQM
jgi:hypothetical protein